MKLLGLFCLRRMLNTNVSSCSGDLHTILQTSSQKNCPKLPPLTCMHTSQHSSAESLTSTSCLGLPLMSFAATRMQLIRLSQSCSSLAYAFSLLHPHKKNRMEVENRRLWRTDIQISAVKSMCLENGCSINYAFD
jgi:hypothetical protein